MKNNTVNDIFQNNNSNKNKTKTILLLTIVAIILISVFLIIAWVMTRDNPIQSIEEVDSNAKITNQQNAPSPIPYAHNIENQNDNPLGINDNMVLQIPNSNQNNTESMSSVPPLSVQSNELEENKGNKTEQEQVGFENDERYKAAYKELELKHETKNKDKDIKQQEKEPTKVITPLPPKDTIIAQAPDPTAKRPVKKEEQKDSAKPKVEAQKKEVVKDTKKEDSKQVEKVVASTQKDKPKEVISKQPSDKVIQRPQNIADANQGKSPEKGHYIQVGSFTIQDKITPEFLNKVSKYSYRKENSEYNGKPSVKYLIGPYKTREEAKQIESKIRTEIKSDAFYVKR